MSEWKEYRLGKCINVINGYAFKSVNFKNEKGKNTLPVIKIRNVANGDVNLENIQYHLYKKEYEKVLVQKGDILIALTGNHPDALVQVVGGISMYKFSEKALLNQRVAKFIEKKDLMDHFFLYYLLKDKSLQDYLANQSSGSANQANISKMDIENMPVTLPPLPEQQAIASILSSLDDKIDLLQRQNTTLEKMAETLFRQWFVVEAKEEWKEGKIGDIINIFDSLRVPLSKIERDKKKEGKLYPYYGAAQVMDYINDYIFDGEYILMGEDGTVRTDDGAPILQYASGKFWVNNHTHVIQAKQPYSNFLIWNLLKQINIDEIVTGAVQPKINQANLKSITILKYPNDLILNFNNYTKSLFQKINQNKKQIRTLTALRDTLLPKLMNGEVRIN